MLKLSVAFGVFAALADVAGFLMAVALLEMTPESLRLNPIIGPVLIMVGYCIVHLLEHTINSHFHFGEEIHHDEFVSARTGYSVLGGLSVHALFDGVAIGSGFVVNSAFGWLIFLAVFLHKAPEGFTMASIMLASGRSRRAAFAAAVALAVATIAGVLIIELAPRWMPYGLPISAGVALYVGASDLVPEVNREPGIRMALVFFLGVVAFLLLRLALPTP
jgi:zinc transporter ZupT